MSTRFKTRSIAVLLTLIFTPTRLYATDPIGVEPKVKSVECVGAGGKPNTLPCTYTCPHSAGCDLTITVRTDGNPPISRTTTHVPQGHMETMTNSPSLISHSMTYPG